MLPTDFKDFYIFFAGVIAVVAWLIRLEAKVLYLAKADEKHSDQRDIIWAKFDTMQETLTEILQAVSKLEGKFER